MGRGGSDDGRAPVERPFMAAAVAAVDEALLGLATPADGGGVGGHGGLQNRAEIQGGSPSRVNSCSTAARSGGKLIWTVCETKFAATSS